MFTKRGQGGKIQSPLRWSFTCQLVQTEERGVYGGIGNADKKPKQRYQAVNHNKIRDS